jgi:hypothetical protein
VRIDLEPSNKSECLVGLIYDTLLLNPDFGRMGPRLSPESELVTFAPDYLNERAVLVGITAIGRIKTGGEIIPLVPRVAANNDALVELMEDDDIRSFHTASGQLTLSYLPVLVQTGKPLAYHVARIVLLKLMDLLPEYEAELDVLEDDMSWLTQIGPLGGVQ